jgi:hypothetical protein
MDIDLLSRMVKELILGHDQVGLPGVGTFVAEMVPASFSDKGYTINPPYRRLSFYPSRLEDSLLIDFYAASNQIDQEAARVYVTQYLAELKSVLEGRKSIILPGLGRLRATKENTLFFVADEGLDIYPAGAGLRPVSLKSHVLEEEPVVIDVPLPVSGREVEPIPQPTIGIEETPEGEEQEQTPAWEEIPAEEEIPVQEEPPVQEDIPVQEELPVQEEPPVQEEVPVRRSARWLVPTLVSVLAVAVIALAVFIILAQVAPDFIDSLLYSPEELRIINY